MLLTGPEKNWQQWLQRRLPRSCGSVQDLRGRRWVIQLEQMVITEQSGVSRRVQLSSLAWRKARIALQVHLNRMAAGSSDVGNGNALLV